jgi:hypothetical protein
MNDELLTYLHDHLAGAKFAIELLTELSTQETEPAVTKLASELISEIEADRNSLQQFVQASGGDHRSMKDLAAWVGEKASRLKLDLKTRLGMFEAVELLCLGVLGKLALWNACKPRRQAKRRSSWTS